MACSDSGYFSLEDLGQVSEDILVVMPTQKPARIGSGGQAQKENNFHPLKPFGKERFQYDSDKDEYVCPEGKILQYVGAAFSSPRKRAYKAAGKDCRVCPHFGVCTTSRDGRRVVRMAEESLPARIVQAGKRASKIDIIVLKGKQYTACENRKWNYPLVI